MSPGVKQSKSCHYNNFGANRFISNNNKASPKKKMTYVLSDEK